VGTVCRRYLFALVLLGMAAQVTAQESSVEAGRRMYQDGVLPSGEPMTALVGGDIPVIGTQFSCDSCHGRSGMGFGEGKYIVPPIAAQFLFVESAQPRRPAYDMKSLARVLREGVTPTGRELLQEVMPRYRLSDDDVVALNAYLATLSAGNSPGVDDAVIHFATVVTEGVDQAEREAVLAVLNRYAEEINRQTRAESERWDRGYAPASILPTVFREWVIDKWTLSGPSESWSAQLDKHYEETPVFAMLSGLGDGGWAPISRFCERRQIPCLLPSTDMQQAADGDFYTLYFSRGLALEADLVAAHLANDPADTVVQVYCDRNLEPTVAALRESLDQAGTTVQVLQFDCVDSVPVTELALQMSGADVAAVLWVTQAQLAGLPQTLPDGRMYVSSTLLAGEPSGPLLSAAGPLFMAHPFRPPGQNDPAMKRFGVWMKTRGIELSAPRHQAEAFFSCLALNHAIKHMGRFFVREYMLDMLDHAQSLTIYLPVYPRPTLGPGQRFLNKGGYVLPIVDGQLQTDGAEWILP